MLPKGEKYLGSRRPLSRMKISVITDISAQISSLGTRMEELALVSDTQFYSMEDRIDQYQTGFTSRFEHFQ